MNDSGTARVKKETRKSKGEDRSGPDVNCVVFPSTVQNSTEAMWMIKMTRRQAQCERDRQDPEIINAQIS